MIEVAISEARPVWEGVLFLVGFLLVALAVYAAATYLLSLAVEALIGRTQGETDDRDS